MILCLLSCLRRFDQHGGIGLELAKPALQVGCRIVEHGLGIDVDMMAEECGCHLGDKLFEAVGLGSESIHFGDALTSQSSFVASGVGEFVEESGVVVLGRDEVGEQWDGHLVGRRRVEGAISMSDERLPFISSDDGFRIFDGIVLHDWDGLHRSWDLFPILELSQIEFLVELHSVEMGVSFVIFTDQPLHDRSVVLPSIKLQTHGCRLLASQVVGRRESRHDSEQVVDSTIRLLMEQIHWNGRRVAEEGIVPDQLLILFHALGEDRGQSVENFFGHLGSFC